MQQPPVKNSVWSMPALLAVLILTGLLVCLLGTGLWHLFGWIVLTIPMLILIIKLIRPKHISDR